MKLRSIRLLSLGVVCLTAFMTVQAQEEPTTPFRVAGNSSSARATLSSDGRLLSFVSDATNLVPDDRNDTTDVFVHDQQTGAIRRVSVASDGSEGNDYSTKPMISGDGRFVVFESRADNLVADDTNNDLDIFIHELETGETRRVSVTSDGVEGDRSSLEPSISADGQRVVFWANAGNLITEDHNGYRDSFMHDLETGETRLISVTADADGVNGDSFNTHISANGNVVAFWSAASNLVAGDTNQFEDIFVHDLNTGEISRVNIAPDGSEANAYTFDTFSLSADGRFVAFQSQATNLVAGVTLERNEIYLHDRQTGDTSHISATLAGPQVECGSFCLGSSEPELSADGNLVVFTSDLDNLVEGDTNESWDVFLYDRSTGSTRRVSVNANGDQLSGSSFDGTISADGRFVAFETGEALVPGDLNFAADIYLHDLDTGEIRLVSGFIGN